MAFYTWIDEAVEGTNVMEENAYSSDSQRENGFHSGQAASSLRVNTALRQATLVTAALMKAMNLDTFDYTTDEATLQTQIENTLSSMSVVPNPAQSGLVDLTRITIAGTIYNIPSGTSVVANPTLSGGETDLTSLQVGSTKYKVSRSIEAFSAYGLGAQPSSSAVDVPLFVNSTLTTTNKLTINNGSIVVGDGVTLLKISAYVTLFYSGQNTLVPVGGISILNGSSPVASSYEYIPNGASWTLDIEMTPRLIKVAKNDVLTLRLQNLDNFSSMIATPYVFIEIAD